MITEVGEDFAKTRCPPEPQPVSRSERQQSLRPDDDQRSILVASRRLRGSSEIRDSVEAPFAAFASLQA